MSLKERKRQQKKKQIANNERMVWINTTHAGIDFPSQFVKIESL